MYLCFLLKSKHERSGLIGAFEQPELQLRRLMGNKKGFSHKRTLQRFLLSDTPATAALWECDWFRTDVLHNRRAAS